MSVIRLRSEASSRGARMLRTALGDEISAWLGDPAVIEVIVGIGSTLFAEFTSAIPAEPTIEDALAIVLASLTLLGLGVFGPGIANGIVAGGPQLGAGAAAGTALLSGGAAAGAVAGTRLAGGAVASAASSVAQGTARAAGGATMAYATGSASRTGGGAAGGGLAGVGRATAGAATSPLRKAADAARASFRDGARAAVGNMGGRIVPAPGTPADRPAVDGSAGPPAWAASMKQRQTLAHSASLAAHTVRAGDGHGAGTSIDTREKD